MMMVVMIMIMIMMILTSDEKNKNSIAFTLTSRNLFLEQIQASSPCMCLVGLRRLLERARRPCGPQLAGPRLHNIEAHRTVPSAITARPLVHAIGADGTSYTTGEGNQEQGNKILKGATVWIWRVGFSGEGSEVDYLEECVRDKRSICVCGPLVVSDAYVSPSTGCITVDTHELTIDRSKVVSTHSPHLPSCG